MATIFENINEHLVYAKAKSKTEALTMRDDAKETSQDKTSVVVFFNGRYHLYLAPGQDPYQIRKEIDLFLNPPPKKDNDDDDEKEETKDMPTRDASGKFVSKKQTTSKPDASAEEKTSKKKNFWDSLK